jgi:carbamoyl-phosphate synthase small subunit
MKLALKDGTVIEGRSFGAPVSSSGEIVFTTGMTGYVETLTDPSYTGQIIVFTYPLIGNYGVPERRFFESDKIHAAGVVLSEGSIGHSHHASKGSLSDWLKKEGVPAITGIDTRELTKRLRTEGTILGELMSDKNNTKSKDIKDPNLENLVAKVSTKKKVVYGNGPLKVILIDCGVKENIVRAITRPETTVIRVPWDYDFSKEKFDGILISNGPGDPARCTKTIENIRKAFKSGKPILGICLGVQLLAMAAGAKTYKLSFGHRSQNQPCLDVTSMRPASSAGRCYITSQNHGFAVKESTLPSDWEVWFKNSNDESVEGIRHKSKPWRAVQFHPEACPGPTDTAWIFEDFIKDMKKHAQR